MKRSILALFVILSGCAGWQPGTAKPGTGPARNPAPTWAMEGGDPSRSSRIQWQGPSAWQLHRLIQVTEHSRYRPEEYAAPLLIEGVAYVGHSGRSFEAIRLSNGEKLWSFATRGRVFTTPAYSEGLLFFGDDEGQVYAVQLDGSEAWRFSARYPVVASPLVAQGKVYVAVADQNVFCLEAATGRPIWQYGRSLPRRNSIWRSVGLAAGQGKVYAGFSDGMVVALDAVVGQVMWRAEVGAQTMFGDVTAGPTFADGSVYVGVFRGPVVCLEADTGKEVWRQKAEATAGFAVGEDTVYAGTPSGTLLALSRADGARVWETPLDGGAPTLPVLARGSVIVGASEGSLHSLAPRSGEVLGRYFPGPGIHAQPLVFEGGALFFSNAGSLNWVD